MAISAYHADYLIQSNGYLRNRVAACAYEESARVGAPLENPDSWAHEHRWEWAASPGWSEAVQSALDAGNDDWGSDPAVITDAMILAAVQPMVAP